jgi:hypothetical protein
MPVTHSPAAAFALRLSSARDISPGPLALWLRDNGKLEILPIPDDKLPRPIRLGAALSLHARHLWILLAAPASLCVGKRPALRVRVAR